jgi:hypothetical protein
VAAVSPSYTTYSGAYFSVDYPDTWDVEAAEVRKGAYYDTTIRSLSDPDLMIRVDVTPRASADAFASANDVESYLAGQPGYRRLRFAPITFGGYDAVDWEFVVSEKGVQLHKQDTFFDDASGNGFAILTQAPANQFARWRAAFEQVRQSLLVAPPPAESAPGDSSTVDFCASHACIDNFYDGGGYIVQCNDGMWSHSGGLPGACSTTAARAATSTGDPGLKVTAAPEVVPTSAQATATRSPVPTVRSATQEGFRAPAPITAASLDRESVGSCELGVQVTKRLP